MVYARSGSGLTRADKYKLGARAGKCKLKARAGQQKLGARARGKQRGIQKLCSVPIWNEFN